MFKVIDGKIVDYDPQFVVRQCKLEELAGRIARRLGSDVAESLELHSLLLTMMEQTLDVKFQPIP